MNYGERCVFVASGQVQAAQVRAFLEASGVTSALRGETLSKTHGLTLDGLGRVEVVVASADAERARALLASAEAGEFQLEDDADVGARRAVGTFDVKLTPQALDEKPADALLGSMSIDKRFHGDLDGMSRGHMLTAGTDVKGSAGYVAIERVDGVLHGRRGTFVLQHNGLMTRGESQLTIAVVPDSGTGELAGLAGTMAIRIAGGQHSYEFEYTLADRG